MARAVSRKPSAWNKAVKAAFAKGAKSFKAAVAAAKKSYRKKSASKSGKKSPKPCPKGSHRRMRGKGSRCVKN
jgi:hypothetical protein